MSQVLLYGKHPINAALSNPKRVIKKIYATNDRLSLIEPLIKNRKIPVAVVDKKYLDKKTNNSNHQNIALECNSLFISGFDFANIRTNRILILDQITDPQNIGSIIRSACAFNYKHIIIPENSCPKENGSMAKSSVGTIEHASIYLVKNLVNTINRLKENGFWSIGLDSHAKIELSDFEPPEKCVFILGSEGKGMRPLVKKSCDILLKIGMSSDSESLNVSCAASIALHKFNNL